MEKRAVIAEGWTPKEEDPKPTKQADDSRAKSKEEALEEHLTTRLADKMYQKLTTP